MKFFNLPVACFFFVLIFQISCNTGNGKLRSPLVDSSVYKAPTPAVIPQNEFNHYYEGIKNFYEKKLLRSGFNGGILVAKKGQIIFEDYHGLFNLKKKDSLNAHSSFHLASVSKTFTAMAILKLAELGKLSINDDVKKYFPDFPYDNVTIQLLLNHRSGLPNYVHFMESLGWDRKQVCSNEDVLAYLIKFKPPVTSRPDTHFAYCNTNYALLGLIIEKASGKSYADFLQEQFFTPLQMTDTYVYSLKDSATAMPSYDWRGREEPFTFLDCGIGDKNIYSTPRDLLKWDQALYTNQIFTPQTLEAAFTPYSHEKPGVRNYGYGWRMNVYPNGKKVIYHNGWWHGNNTVFIRMIQDSVTIIVLGNKYNRLIYDAKDMETVFDPGSYLSNEDNATMSKEEINTNENPDSVLKNKILFSRKKVPAKKSTTHRKR